MPQHKPTPTEASNPAKGVPYILVVDDEPDIRNLVREILEDEGYEVAVAENGSDARDSQRARRPDLVLLDIWMPDVDGITLLKEWSREEGGLSIPVIMMSGHGTVETAVEATRLGAYDFIEKPLSLAKLLLTIEHALEADKLQRENQGLRKRGQLNIELLGKSASMQGFRENVKRIAEHDTWILLSGEPGTELEITAQYLHQHSSRKDRPFIDVNVATLSPDNAAKELFGSEVNGKITYGLLEQASGGTLYLHDMSDMDLESQAKFFSALEKKSFMRIGGNESVTIHIRIIAATHRNLQKLVEDGHFREDLYYQLNVVPVNVPPLREHHEDVPELLNHYIDLFVEHDNLPYRKFSMAAQNKLRNHSWPGNVRELKNTVQRLLIVGAGTEIDVNEINNALGQIKITNSTLQTGFDLPLREAREQFERNYIIHQLKIAKGSVGKAAKTIGLERTHLYRKLRSLEIDPKHLDDD
ncbi:Response regulator of zinc sigma-54-dependent two-component system [hydrothermal vent metagenome]|uniref:Response regulator of zinc sigma-54-dependent two-component system n=1 Tax=hydrothermal vent metagenome TaxID=652676 RepID=A0A3B0ZTW6_9ZZZZ